MGCPVERYGLPVVAGIVGTDAAGSEGVQVGDVAAERRLARTRG